MFGIPLKDGMIIGVPPKPSTQDKFAEFNLRGVGPAIVIRVLCEDDFRAAPQITFVPSGSAATIANQHLGTDSLFMTLKSYLPVRAFFNTSRTKVIQTPWVEQYCSLNAYVGKANWTQQYSVDSFFASVPGNLTNVDINGDRYDLATSPNLYTTQILKSISNQKNAGNSYAFNSTVDEGTLLLGAMQNAIQNAFGGTQYVPTWGSSLISNMMSWAIDPDGTYHIAYVSRGMMASIAALMHQVFKQSTGIQTTCKISGKNGYGVMDLGIVYVYIFDILVGVITIFLFLHVVTALLLYRVKERLVFRRGALVMRLESTRMLYATRWSNSLLHDSKYFEDSEEAFNDTDVRLGETKETIGTSNAVLAIGTKRSICKLRVNRLKFVREKVKDTFVEETSGKEIASEHNKSEHDKSGGSLKKDNVAIRPR